MMSNENEINYLDLDDALALHVSITEATDYFPQPLRSADALQSALNRARTFGHYRGLDLIGQAARLGTGISRAQAFLDGNKRTAFACLDVFLRLNGMAYAGDPVELGMMLDNLASPDIIDDEADDRFDQWLRERTGPLP